MISSICLENWRSHEKTELAFRKGTNLLVGIMGSGKSSVLDAMSFGLFGTFPALERKALTLDQVVRHGKSAARVRLAFQKDGTEYEILRIIGLDSSGKRASGEAEIRKAGKLVEKGQKAVTGYVCGLLRMDYDLFSRAIYSSQNNIDYFLSLNAAKRKEEMDGLLGLDKFEAARANCVTLLNRVRDGRKGLEAGFSQAALSEAKAKEKEAEGRCASLKAEIGSLAQAAEKAEAAHRSASASFSELRARREKADSLRQKMAEARGAMETLKQELAGKRIGEEDAARARKGKEESEKALADARKAAREAQETESSLSKDAGRAESELAAAKEAMEELEQVEKELGALLAGRKPGELESERKSLADDGLKMAAERRALLDESKKLAEALHNLAPGLSRCPLCRSPLARDGIEHVRDECRQEMEARGKRAAELEKEIAKNGASLLEIEKKIRLADGLAQRAKALAKPAGRIGECRERLEKARAGLSKISGECLEMRKAAEKAEEAHRAAAMALKEAEELLAKAKRLAHAEAALEKSGADLAALKFDEHAYEKGRKGAEEARVELEKAQLAHLSAEKEMRSAGELLGMASAQRKRLEEAEREISEALRLEEELAIYRNALIETQSALRQGVIEAINSAMNGIWSVIYPYGDYRGVRVNAGGKGYDFEIYDEEWRDAELASGGERASMALAFRIALSTVLTPGAGMLVLDEPTHNLDKEAVAVLAHALQDNLPELVEQSFVITHDEGLMGSEFASTYRMTRDKETNSPTKAEEI